MNINIFPKNPYVMPGLKSAGFTTIADVNKSGMIAMETIAMAVCEYFKIPEEHLSSKIRVREDYNWPRQCFCYLARKHSGETYKSIGWFLGGRDHSTVMHALKTMQAAMDNSIKFPKHPDALWVHALAIETNLTLSIKTITTDEIHTFPNVFPQKREAVKPEVKKAKAKEKSIVPEKKIWSKDRHVFRKASLTITAETSALVAGNNIFTNYGQGVLIRKAMAKFEGKERWLVKLDSVPQALKKSTVIRMMLQKHSAIFIETERIKITD